MATNVLVATSNVKFYTGITTTSYDALIETMNPIVLDDIVNYTKNSFFQSTRYFYIDDVSFTTSTGFNTIISSDTEVDFTDYFTDGSIMNITKSVFNDAYYSLSTVATSYVKTNESIATETSSTGKSVLFYRTQYPKDLPFIASRMIKHLIDVRTRADVQSESLGDYSVTFVSVGSNSYPASIVSGLNKYRKVGMK